MTDGARSVQRTYLLLILLSTLAASFIWGINTLFLLDAGLSNTEAFAANAFFTLGQVVFEVPTGVVADTVGRRASYLLGAGTLLVSTLLYLRDVADRGAAVGLGAGLGDHRARFHLLLGGRRGVAGRRPRLQRVRRQSGGCLRKGPGRDRSSDADRIGRRRLHRPGDQPRRALHRPCGGARRHPRHSLAADEGRRVHTRAICRTRRRGAAGRLRVHRRRVAQTSDPMAHAGVAVLHGRRHLRLLCDAAIPPGAVR